MCGGGKETNRANKRLRDGEAQDEQDLPTNKKQKAPSQEPVKAEIPETGSEGKRKGKAEKEGEELPPLQANTMIRYLTTIQANPEVSKLNQEKNPKGDG
jgi:hypothetical protein